MSQPHTRLARERVEQLALASSIEEFALAAGLKLGVANRKFKLLREYLEPAHAEALAARWRLDHGGSGQTQPPAAAKRAAKLFRYSSPAGHVLESDTAAGLAELLAALNIVVKGDRDVL